MADQPQSQSESENKDVDMQNLFQAPDQQTEGQMKFGQSEADLPDMDNTGSKYSLRSWWNSIQAIDGSNLAENYKKRAKLYYRALSYLPGSYKLWYHFLRESVDNCKRYPITNKRYGHINNLFEKALVYMNKMPRIWLDYCKFLGRQKLVSKTRETYERAMVALPITQHDAIWPRYMEWIESLKNIELIKKIMTTNKYLKFAPQHTEKYINILLEHGEIQEAVDMYISLLDPESSKYGNFGKVDDGKSIDNYELWMQLCELISKHPTKINLPNAEDIIRHGIRKYTDEVGKLWICLADYNTRLANFEKAREIFEEAIASVTTARDFGIVYNAYLNFEETIIENDGEYTEYDTKFEDQLEGLIDDTLNSIEDRKAETQLSEQKQGEGEDNQKYLTRQDEDDYKYYKLEKLIERREFLLSNAVLRQNPSNVYEWLQRITLCGDDDDLKVQTYLEAIFQIDPLQAYGKASKIWIEFALFYEAHSDLKNANEIFKRAIKVTYKSMDELATVYCAWAEMHIRHKNYQSAILILNKACSSKKERGMHKKERDDCLHLSIKLWNFYADLQESLGTFEQAKMVYDRMMDLKVASPQTILNYCAFLERNLYFEESFRVYERALSLFEWPHAYDIWVIYLSKFIERYNSSPSGTDNAAAKIERTRDLFEQVLTKCPKSHKNKKLFYYMYADFEENFGLISHVSEILDRATKELSDPYPVFLYYIAKTAEYYGITKTRSIYERAFEVLEGNEFVDIGLKFSKLERKLGEIDRARGIYQHMSQFCNPQIQEVEQKFWNVWEKFEIYHGNEDTYKEFMKYKRTVEMRYSISVPFQNMNPDAQKQN